jgi:hypothetical protein
MDPVGAAGVGTELEEALLDAVEKGFGVSDRGGFLRRRSGGEEGGEQRQDGGARESHKFRLAGSA